jgi:hypothetical protein
MTVDSRSVDAKESCDFMARDNQLERQWRPPQLIRCAVGMAVSAAACELDGHVRPTR